MDANQWPQEGGRVMKAAAATGMVTTTSPSSSEQQQRGVKGRPQKDQVVNCPRCQSTNTKFCYYNNYSLTQPRYFCKTCRRYWTSGGTLRNVPVGGGSRKNRRSSSSSSSSISTHKIPTADHANMLNINNSHFSPSSSNPNHHQGGHDLNLSFPYGQHEYHHFAPQIQLFEFPRYETSNNGDTVPPPLPHELIMKPPFPALELLRNNNAFSNSTCSSNKSIIEASANSSPVYNVGFPFQELKPTTTGLSFSVVDRYGSSNRYVASNNGASIGMDEEQQQQQQQQQRDNNCEKVMFPLEASTNHHMQQNKGSQQNSNGIWNGMLGGGAW